MAILPQENVFLNQSLPANAFMPEPQNDPYWPLKGTGNISKCYGCKSDLDNFVLGRIECDIFPLIQKEKNIKVWFPESSPKYYHSNLLCLKKRRPNVKVTLEVIKCHEDAVITEEIEACLFKQFIHFILIELRIISS